MKITDPDVIKNGEKDLIDSVKDDLDLDAVKQILEKKIAATTLSAKGGQIVVHNNEIAFRMDFDLNLSGSLMFDRNGNYISDTDEDSVPDDIEQDDTDSGNIDSGDIDLEDAALDDMDVPETEDLDLDIDLDDDLKIELPEFDSEDENAQEDPLGEAIEGEDDNLTDPLDIEPDMDDDTTDNLVDDDIDDILKESQDFWDKKKTP